MEFLYTYDEIDYTVVVNHFHHQPADKAADNPDDYYGYIECDFDLHEITGKGVVCDCDLDIATQTEIERIIWDNYTNDTI